MGLVFGSLVLLMAAGSSTLYRSIKGLETQLTVIVEVARPMNAAAYEMEINAVEVGLKVVKYLHRPDIGLLEEIAKDVADFDKFISVYRKLAFTGGQKDLAEQAGLLFSRYVALGYKLIDAREEFLTQANEVSNKLIEIKEITDQTMVQLRVASNATPLAIEQLSGLRSEVSEALGLLSMASLAGDRNGLSTLAMAMVHVEQRLSAYSAGQGGSKAADMMAANFTASMDLIRLLGETILLIDEGYLQFIALRVQIDDLLDEEIQAQAAQYLQLISYELRKSSSIATQVLVGLSLLGILLSIGAMLFIVRGIVAPVRKLARAANVLSEGDLSQRVNLPQKDELGSFARTFNMMAERLQAAHDRLSRANLELDARVAERTSELAEANEQLGNELALRKKIELELLDATEAAKMASEAKTMFLGNMSHELRTPLNAIIGFSDIIRSELFGPSSNAKYIDYANDINQSGLHLLRLINELLDVARIEAGHLNLTEEEFDLAAIIISSLHMLEDQAQAKRVFLRRDIASGLPCMYGDITRVQQIFINLIGNAIKFTPPEASVSVSASQLPGGELQISVADTGIGIAKENLAKVLETFGQVANTLTRAHEGAGLGLPLAKLLTVRHDGALHIESEPGRGTIVTVTFPRSRVRPRQAVREQAV